MKQHPLAVWVPFGFSVVLSAISLVAFAATGGSGAWVPAFISFLPMSFFFLVTSQNQARAQVAALEARVRQLEAESPAALGAPVRQEVMGLATELRAKALDPA